MKLFVLMLLSLFCTKAFSSEISYEIYDKVKGKLIAKGVTSYSSNDVISRYRDPNKSTVEKYIELKDGYKIGARIFSVQKLTGFGLLAQLTVQDFSWEWYELENGSIFRKLQGRTFVKTRVSGGPLLEILEEVDFLDDTTLRFKAGGAGQDDSHEIIIKKGSVLKFD